MHDYLHGYSEREARRLSEQSEILEALLHGDVSYPAGSRVLEAGCGVGAQTRILARKSSGAAFVSVDISAGSLAQAAAAIRSLGLNNVTFLQADLMRLEFEPESFDHLFVCFVLEHLPDPMGALFALKALLRPGGTITAIEGDHGSCFWHPETADSLQAWAAMVASQKALGHDPLIGRRLYPLLLEAGFAAVEVAPRWVYADGKDPVLLDGVLNKIIVPMVETARRRSTEAGLIDAERFDRGVRDLVRAGAPPDGTFFYTWFRARAVKGAF